MFYLHFRDLFSVVPGGLQATCGWHNAGGGGGKLHTTHSDERLQLDLCVTQVAEALSRTERICRQKTRGGGTDKPVVSALCNRTIYEQTPGPSLQRELVVCDSICCANISCFVAPAAIVRLSGPLLVSHPV